MYVKRVDCQGTESDLFDCRITQSSCSHTNVAGVICGRNIVLFLNYRILLSFTRRK